MTKYRMRAAALLAAGAVAGGATAATLTASAEDTGGDRAAASADAEGGPGRGGPGGHGGPGGPGVDTAALAEELGVGEDELDTALQEAREQLAPAERPSGDADGERPAPPTEEERAERESAFTAALAVALDLDEDVVAEALETLRAAAAADRRDDLAERLDAAVADGDLTDADRASVLKAYDAGVLGRR